MVPFPLSPPPPAELTDKKEWICDDKPTDFALTDSHEHIGQNAFYNEFVVQ